MIWNAFILALREIRRNILRSVLTSLGIIIGVASVITMVTLGSGATEKVKLQIANLGANLIQLRAGQDIHGPGGIRASANPFTIEDAVSIKNEIPGVEAAAPIAGSSTQAIYGNRNWSSMITGSTNDFFEARDWPVVTGRKFTPWELRAGLTVCLLGQTVAKELFENENPVGAFIRLKKLSFRVIGVLDSKGESTFGRDRDDFILVPLRTYQRRIGGNTDVQRVYISVLDGHSIDQVIRETTTLMRERRRIRPGEDADFYIRDMREISNVLSGTTRVLTSLLGAIAAVSLLVGGIGIMNIMLVAVTERTREIGTRLAIGALAREVLMQFLVEAVVLSCMGGLAGIALALVISAILAKLLLVPLIIQPGIIALAFGFSAGIGVVFGFFPARNAAHLDPIEALRHE